MTDTGTSPELPAFEGPNFPETEEIDDDLEDDLEEDLEQEFTSAPNNQVEADPDDDSANRVAGGVARSVLEFVARSIVDDPEAVHVEVEESRATLKLSLHVAPSDMGRIIGKRGRVAQAIRALVRAAAAREGTDASVDIVD